jgi:rRNA maturation RNase YbeY
MGRAESLVVDVTGKAIPRLTRRAIKEFVIAALGTMGRMRLVPRPINEVSIAFVDDTMMRSLNRRFRGKNKTTDVLTFEGGQEPSGLLGEIIVSIGQARRQAATLRHSLPTEIRYLLLHGILHALGYDHEADHGEMNTLELKLRERMGLE